MPDGKEAVIIMLIALAAVSIASRVPQIRTVVFDR